MGTQFDPVNKYILITSPTTEVSALELYNVAMDWCDDQPTMGYDVPMRADGKFDMGGGAYSDSIFRLINGWKLKPWSGTYSLLVTGTLLPEPGESRTVPPDSGNVDITFQVSSQGIISDPFISEAEEQGIADEVWATQGRGLKLDELRVIAALEETLAAIKGSGWSEETLKKIKELNDEIKQLIEDIGPIEVTPKAMFVL